MRGLCQKCVHYYQRISFKDHSDGATEKKLFSCDSPSISQDNIPKEHPFKLANLGHDIEIVECSAFEWRKFAEQLMKLAVVDLMDRIKS